MIKVQTFKYAYMYQLSFILSPTQYMVTLTGHSSSNFPSNEAKVIESACTCQSFEETKLLTYTCSYAIQPYTGISASL